MIAEVFALLARSPAPLLVIGGHALAAHGIQRMTFDVDCLVATGNFDALASLLMDEGFANVVHQMHFSAFYHRTSRNIKIDVMRVPDSTFAQLQDGSKSWDFGGPELQVPALEHLIALKLHATKNNPERRPKDGWDIEALLHANPGAITREKLRDLCEKYGPPNEWENKFHLYD